MENCSKNGTHLTYKMLASMMVNVVDDRKVKKRIIREGSGEVPEQTDLVSVNCYACVENKLSPIYTTYERKLPLIFPMDDPGLVSGLLIAIKSMTLNEKAQFLIHPDLVYRNNGIPKIRYNSRIFFEIELLDFYKFQDILSDIKKVYSEDELQHLYLIVVSKGYKQEYYENYHYAIKYYWEAIRIRKKFPKIIPMEQELDDDVCLKILTRILGCYTKGNEPERGCEFFDQIDEFRTIAHRPIRGRCFFYHAKCLEALGDFKMATIQMEKAVRCASGIEKFREELKRMRNVLNQQILL